MRMSETYKGDDTAVQVCLPGRLKAFLQK
jgi:hypothetical protein